MCILSICACPVLRCSKFKIDIYEDIHRDRCVSQFVFLLSLVLTPVAKTKCCSLETNLSLWQKCRAHLFVLVWKLSSIICKTWLGHGVPPIILHGLKSCMPFRTLTDWALSRSTRRLVLFLPISDTEKLRKLCPANASAWVCAIAPLCLSYSSGITMQSTHEMWSN